MRDIVFMFLVLTTVARCASQTQGPASSNHCFDQLCELPVGKLSLNVLSVPSVYTWTVPALSADQAMFSVKGLEIKLAGKTRLTEAQFLGHTTAKSVGLNNVVSVSPTSTGNSAFPASKIAAIINLTNQGFSAETVSDRAGSETLIIRTSAPFTDRKLEISGLNPASQEATQSGIKGPRTPAILSIPPVIGQNFVVWLNPEQVKSLGGDGTRVSVRLSSGSMFDLYSGSGNDSYSWTYLSDRSNSDPGPMIVVVVSKASRAGANQICPINREGKDRPTHSYGYCLPSCERDWFADLTTSSKNSYARFCSASFLFVRQKVEFSANSSVLPGLEEIAIGIKTDADGKLEVNPVAFEGGGDFTIDGKLSVSGGPNGDTLFRVDPGPGDWVVDWTLNPIGCRPLAEESPYRRSITMRPPRNAPDLERSNGILVGAAKIFDVHALQKMLNDAASQLALISVFNSNQLGAAVGTLQGVTRDASYINGQIGTAPTSSLTQSAVTGSSNPNTLQTTTPIGNTTTVLQCPDGSLPTIGTANTLGGCAAVPVTGTTANVPAYAPVTSSAAPNQGILTTTPAGASVANTGSTTTAQTSSTTTMGSVSGVPPGALVSTALAAPTNVNVGSSDILAEQVQLNAQLVGYRLLLQGALSDQYLAKNSTAVGTRRQTTLGFTINLDPPRQFKHAVAEVRIIIEPAAGNSDYDNPVSLMTLLPAEKTYNVAKVTSHQNAFGGGAVIEPVSFGVSAGKSRDRLYLAKDTDTLAFQFRPAAMSLRTPFPLLAHNSLQKVRSFETLSACDYPDNDFSSEALVFGWQFRPVLGEEYVIGGQRQVFAQLALPIDLRGQYVPAVTVQTRWRDYDPKSQTVGSIYKDSCSETTDQSGVMLTSEPRVDNVRMTDLGGGQISLTARGQFYSSSLGILAGSTLLAPRSFDGKSLGLIAAAHDLLLARDLYIIDSNGTASPFSMSPNPSRSCGLSDAVMRAVPYPDGNARATLEVTLGADFNLSETGDGYPHPLVMVGDSVYGLRETPYLDDQGGVPCYQFNFGDIGEAVPKACRYLFMAPTTSLRNAQTFLTSELTWSKFSKSGKIAFAPSFTSLALVSSSGSGDDSRTVYSVSGFDLSRLQLPCKESFGDSLSPCLQIRVGDQSFTSEQANFALESDNQAVVSFSKKQLGNAKAVRMLVYWQVVAGTDNHLNDPGNTVEWSLSLPKADAAPVTPSPSFVLVGDSRTVTFSGGDLCTATKSYIVSLEGISLPQPSCNGTSLSVSITTAVTKVPGHKELTLSAGGIAVTSNGKPLVLPIDVLKH